MFVLFIMTLLLGYLAEQEKQWRGELLTVATLLKRPNVATGMSGTLRAVGDELLAVFKARTILFVTQEVDAKHVFIWNVSRASTGGVEAKLHRCDGRAAEGYIFDAPKLWTASAGARGVTMRVLTDDGMALRPISALMPPAFFEAHPCSSILAVRFNLADTSGGRVFVLDSASPASPRALQFLETLVEHVGPAIYNVYLLRRLRARAGAAERARVARELHDGAVQALIGLEMEIQALRLGKGQQAGLDAELKYMQSLVRRQGLELRELMLQLRPLDLESTDRLPDLLASMVEKFRRDTGISARFVSTAERMTIPPRAAVELARIVQEALVNVRRHSRASNVLVRLDADQDGWLLSIDDDGRGFGFAGRLSDRELDERRLGPAVIRERARAIGAALVIDSRPGSGARPRSCWPEWCMPESGPSIRILVADDHPIFRHGLRKLLEVERDFVVVGEADDGGEALQQAVKLHPDVLLLDVAMPRLGGLEALPDLCASSPAMRVLLLTASIGHSDILRALQTGARGVLLKDAAVRLLPRAIRGVMEHGYWIGPEPAADLSQAMRRLADQAPDRRYGLTPREIEIVSAVVGGQNNRDIANHFSISQQTVKHHLTSIFDKLGVLSRLELALFALKNRLTDEK